MFLVCVRTNFIPKKTLVSKAILQIFKLILMLPFKTNKLTFEYKEGGEKIPRLGP